MKAPDPTPGSEPNGASLRRISHGIGGEGPFPPCAAASPARRSAGPTRAKPSLDALDHEIMQRLSINARTSNRSIGRALHLSESVVRGRVRRLHALGVIRFSAITNSRLCGPLILVHLWIDATDAAAISPLAEALAKLPQFHLVMTTIGRADILAMTAVRDCATLVDRLQRTLTGIQGIAEVRYSLSQQILKQATMRYGEAAAALDHARLDH